MLAVVKLREKGTTMVSRLPKGVFRHMLEYKFPTESWRYCDPCGRQMNDKQDRHFPAVDKLHFNNYLVAVKQIGTDCQFQFTLKDGANCGTKGDADNWTCHQVSLPQAQISKIEIGYGTVPILFGLKFYSKDGALVLKTARDWVGHSNVKTHTVQLEDGERVIGFKSGSDPSYPNRAHHCDF